MGERCRFYVDVIAQHSEVTGSLFLLVIRLPGDKNVIKGVIDCGIFQERKYEELNQKFNFNARNVSFVLLTHAHMDHIGRVPKMVKEGYTGYIFATEDTCRLLPDALTNGLKVLKKNAKLRHQQNLVIYDEKHIEETVKRTCPLEYLKEYQIHENVKVTFLPNGHLVGAAMIYVDIYDYENNHIHLLFTGDYNNKNIFLEGHEIPEEILQKPINIITESTYGGTSTGDEDEKGKFEKAISAAVSANKKIIVPAFALGRSQEVLYTLKSMQDNHKLPVSIPIYLDGTLAMQYTDLYQNGLSDIKHEMLEFLPKNFLCVTSEKMRSGLLTDDKCKIIVTTSGMGKHGPARFYIPNVLENKKALIHFTGYCAEGTYGRILKETIEEEEIMLGGLLLTKKADVEFTSEFSSHAKADEILNLIKKFEKPLSVIVNHGAEETKKEFALKIRRNIKTKKIGIIDAETIFRIGQYGIVKTISIFDK